MELNFDHVSFGDLGYDHYPKLVKVRQNFETPELPDVEAEARRQLARPEVASLVKPGARLAVLVGSRGIYAIDRIVRTVLDELKALGAEPFIVPAMASHGGATAQGQRDLLASYGITEQAMGVEIRSDMVPEQIGVTPSGVKVYFDVNALHADGVIPINRIKCHTAFRGATESGLMKILAIGAGKQMGAESLHSHGADTFATLLPEVYEVICRHAKVLFGVGIVENANERTAILEAIPAAQIHDREVELLKLANQYMPKILIDEFDGLIVGETGKNYSGDGMDPNIMGRFAVPNMTGGACYQRMALLDVSEESHGNAVGMGLADVVPQSLVAKANFAFMYMNAFTSKMVIPLVKIPIVAKDDRDAIGVMLRSCCRVEYGKERVVAIPNTLNLKEIWISESLLPVVESDPRFTVVGRPQPMEFDVQGRFLLLRRQGAHP